ncbi:hypothetical protein ACJW30_08G018800 [Castanea mollissima]
MSFILSKTTPIHLIASLWHLPLLITTVLKIKDQNKSQHLATPPIEQAKNVPQKQNTK